MISVIIPTQRRPAGLAAAMASVLGQTGLELQGLELVVVDNDRTPSARDQVAAAAAGAPFPVVYVHEPRSGVASARNAALSASRGDLIAFLDDDEEAPPHWLSALLAAQAEFDADVVFGPVRGRAAPEVTRHRAYLEWFFSRLGPDRAGLIPGFYGCGDSLIRRSALPDWSRPFAEFRNQIGGEDDFLFAQMKAAGARFAWAPEAWVWEDPVPDRQTLGYALARAFAYGQGPCSACWVQDPPDRAGIARWMLIGAAQAALYGLAALVQRLAGRPDWAFTLDRAARGLGKVLWWGPFRIAFYGLPASA